MQNKMMNKKKAAEHGSQDLCSPTAGDEGCTAPLLALH